MAKTAVIYWSGTGNTQEMANAVFEGAKAANADSALFAVSETDAASAATYDVLLLGCPAMGAEVLEEDEFEPFFTELESRLAGKKVGLFGSYGWGDGEWMRDWEERVKAAGAELVGGEGLIVNESPDDAALENCRTLGKTAAA